MLIVVIRVLKGLLCFDLRNVVPKNDVKIMHRFRRASYYEYREYFAIRSRPISNNAVDSS